MSLYYGLGRESNLEVTNRVTQIVINLKNDQEGFPYCAWQVEELNVKQIFVNSEFKGTCII